MTDAGPFYEGLLALALDRLKIRYEYEPIDIIPNVKELYENNKIPRIFIIPDFVISDDDGNPKIILYVTHWRASDTSHYKFWRTIEEFFEHKVGFKDIISINVLFEVRKDGDQLVSDGWREGLLYAMDWMFDRTVYLWPGNLIPIVERNRRKIRTNKVPLIKEKIEGLLENDEELRDIFTLLLNNLRTTFQNLTRKKNFDELWSLERKYSKKRNPDETELEIRTARWRRGSLLYLLTTIVIDTKITNFYDQWQIIYKLATSKTVKELVVNTSPSNIKDLLIILKQLIVRRKQGKPVYLIKIEEPISLDSDLLVYDELVWFISELKDYTEERRIIILEEIDKLKHEVSLKNSVISSMEDIRNPQRIRKKVTYFLNNLKKGISESSIRESIVNCRNDPSFLGFKETLNFVFEIFMIACKLSTYKLTPVFNREFRKKFGYSLNEIFSNTARMLIRDIYSNFDIRLKEERITDIQNTFDDILGLFSKIFLERLRAEELDENIICILYLERKVLRLIGAQPDINPFQRILEKLLDGVSFRKGKPFYSFISDYLETIDPKWKRNASTSFPLIIGQPEKGIPTKVIAATGRENVNHKRKEMSGRLKALRYKYDPETGKITRRFPLKQKFVIVVDGDWIYYDACNLYESGYEVLQIRNLQKLQDFIK